MMSAAQSQTTMEAKLKALECHFTWDLETCRSKLFRLRDTLEDIGIEEAGSWLGHINNLQGYIHYQLGFTEDARRFFNKAKEAFHQSRNTDSDKGPWLVVNYGNLAWLHHHLGEQAESQTYLSKIDALLKEYPSPSQDELHPEIYAEKAWTLMKFSTEKKLLAADYFKRAIRMQPDVVEWHSNHVIALVNAYKDNKKTLEEDILEKMEIANEHDPENLYLAALYLEECAKKGRNIEDEARELARRVLTRLTSSHNGIIPLLRLCEMYLPMDETIDLVEEALEEHPDDRHLKWCAATCYKSIIYSHKYNLPEQRMIDRAISLHKEVISLYPHSSLKIKIYLAIIYTKSSHSQAEAEKIYQELLESDLEPEDRQMLLNFYAKHLHFVRNDTNKSIEYHMKAAEIPNQSPYRKSSIQTLEKIRDRNRNPKCAEIKEFLANLRY